MSENVILRMNAVCKRIGVCRSSVYRFMAHNDFPKPIELGSRSRGWLEVEISKWISQRADSRKSKSQDEFAQ
jgi:prophage regulatory protein